MHGFCVISVTIAAEHASPRHCRCPHAVEGPWRAGDGVEGLRRTVRDRPEQLAALRVERDQPAVERRRELSCLRHRPRPRWRTAQHIAAIEGDIPEPRDRAAPTSACRLSIRPHRSTRAAREIEHSSTGSGSPSRHTPAPRAESSDQARPSRARPWHVICSAGCSALVRSAAGSGQFAAAPTQPARGRPAPLREGDEKHQSAGDQAQRKQSPR